MNILPGYFMSKIPNSRKAKDVDVWYNKMVEGRDVKDSAWK
jgi:hypothetical protein